MSNNSAKKTHKLVVAAMLSTLAFILMFIETPVPMLIPSFVKLDISDLPAIMGAFALGPIWGAGIELIKNLLFILLHGTGSAYVGELFNFICGAAYAITAGLVYKTNKSKKGALIASICAAVVMGVISVPLNYFVVYPAYVELFHLPLPVIIGMYQALNPAADTLLKCLLMFNLPFTIGKGMLDAIICMLVYKPLSPILHK